MKILFVIDTLGSGGKERRLTELLKALRSCQDIDYELVVMSTDVHYKEVFELDIKIRFITRKTRKDILLFSRFFSLCREFRPDIVHCWDSMSAIYLAPVCKMLKIKLVNGMVIDSPVRQNIFNKHWFRARLTFPLSDVVVCNSEAGSKAYKAPAGKSIVIHTGFNFNRLNDMPSPELIRGRLEISTPYIVGMVASFSAYKDYPTYFRAANILLEKRDDITFLAIGNGTDSEECHKLIDPRYVYKFRLLGKKRSVESYINTMDICVLSTFTEGISNSILEYMALGKPVIATSGGGTNELVTDGLTGYLIDKSNPAKMSEMIDLLLNDKHMRNEMGVKAKQEIKDNFSMDRMIGEYMDLYKKIA